MTQQYQQPDKENERLRRCMSDLVSLSALPAMWVGGDLARIGHVLLDVLSAMLDVDFLYVRLLDHDGRTAIEMARTTELMRVTKPSDIGRALSLSLGDVAADWPQTARISVENVMLSIAQAQLGMNGQAGVLVAGANRLTFPVQAERLLLNVSGNQAAIAVKEAHLLIGQRQYAAELDRRVAERTDELAATNRDLRVEIAERRRVEEALRDSENSARTIVDSIAGLVAILTPSGDVEVVNSQVIEYCGSAISEFKHWGENETLHPDDLPDVAQKFTNAITSGEAYDFEARIRRFDGVYRWFQVRGLPFRDADGVIVRWYALLTDIDERKRAEERLRRSEMLLAAGERISLTGTFSWRIDTDEILFSEELNRIFEFDGDVAVTVDQITSRVLPEDLPLLAERMEQIRSGRDNPEYEIRLRGSDNGIKYVRVVGRIIRHGDGRLECLGAVQDITQRRLAEEARDAIRSELAHFTRVMSLGELTASIAHEVNQPLSGIITNASTCLRILASNPPNVAGAIETARRTIRDGNRAADVISRLRALFRKRTAVIEPVDLNEAAREVVALLSSDLRRAHIQLTIELADDLPYVGGDRVQLQQVIMNLLRNAVDAMICIDDRPRRLLVRTETHEGESVRMSVRDTGGGFGPIEAERLFDAFYTTKSEGMGIGLSVSRSIIESHGGRIWAAANDGSGTTMIFYVPRYPGASEQVLRSVDPKNVLDWAGKS